MRTLLLTVFCLGLVGCSTAGPFVTGISSDGRGNLFVEKAHVEYNGLLGVVGTKDTTTQTINLGLKEEK